MTEVELNERLQALASSLDALIVFAEHENDPILAARLEEARLRFADRFPIAQTDLEA